MAPVSEARNFIEMKEMAMQIGRKFKSTFRNKGQKMSFNFLHTSVPTVVRMEVCFGRTCPTVKTFDIVCEGCLLLLEFELQEILQAL